MCIHIYISLGGGICQTDLASLAVCTEQQLRRCVHWNERHEGDIHVARLANGVASRKHSRKKHLLDSGVARRSGRKLHRRTRCYSETSEGHFLVLIYPLGLAQSYKHCTYPDASSISMQSNSTDR